MKEESLKRRSNKKENRGLIRIRNVRFVRRYLERHPCIHCGITDIRVLHFDHINRDDKKSSISKLKYTTMALSTIKIEIEKCQILCANCHAIKTLKEASKY